MDRTLFNTDFDDLRNEVEVSNNISTALTDRILENALTNLETLRAGLDRAGLKDIDDVRLYGDSMAGAFLAGYEDRIGYSDLLDLIAAFKRGIASRVLAAD